MTASSNNASVRRTAVALVTHYRRGDVAAMWATLESLTGEDLAAVNVALVGLAAHVLDTRPDDPDRWLADAALALAVNETPDTV